MSPELGIKNGQSDNFFIGDKNLLRTILVDNARWVMSATAKAIARLQMSVLEGSYYSVSFGDGNCTI
jgi:hypothetical protein